MKNFGLVIIIVMEAFFVSSSDADAERGSCSAVIKQDFLNGFNNVMIAQRFTFINDFKKLCRNFQKDRWLNLTEGVVCFGARDNKFASVVSPYEGFLTSLKLVHVTGQVTCDRSAAQYNSKWGCSRRHPTLGKTPFNVVITAGQHNGILYPSKLFVKDKKEALWYDLPDVDTDSPELVLGDSSYPYYVTSGQELRIWLGKDLGNSGNSAEQNDAGNVCVIVKGWFMF